jgi:hypothetical protein
MLSLLNIDEHSQTELGSLLVQVAAGLRDIEPPVGDLAGLRELLLGSFPSLGRAATA